MTNRTYIEMVNKLLRRLNEVELTEDNFDQPVGLQKTAKDAVFDAINQIYNHRTVWPFLAAEHTIVLTPGETEYAWPINLKTVDWNSFEIIKDTNLNVNTRPLKVLDKNLYYRYYRNNDIDAGISGLNCPIFVINTHGTGFGVTPSPDKQYTLKYRYFFTPSVLSEANSEVLIPTEFEYVIMAGSLYHMYIFHDNTENTDRMKVAFKQAMDEMSKALIGNIPFEAFDDRRVRNGR